MSDSLETLNRGTVDNVGYIWGDVSRVVLGELPAMPLSQFCTFATDTLIEAYQQTDLKQQKQIRDIVIKLGKMAIEGLKVREEPSSVFDAPRFFAADHKIISRPNGEEIHQFNTGNLLKELSDARRSNNSQRVSRLYDELAMARSEAEGRSLYPYPENPFKVAESVVSIADTYQVDLIGFTRFAIYVLRGGTFGWWKDDGIPKPVFNALQRLIELQ
jgi:hypothetical protein